MMTDVYARHDGGFFVYKKIISIRLTEKVNASKRAIKYTRIVK